MRLRHRIGFAVFCLLAGSRWLVATAWPQTVPPLVGLGLEYAVAGFVALAWALVRSEVREAGKLTSWRIAAASLLVIGAPVLLQQLVPSVRPETRVALYGMAPLCIVGFAVVRDERVRAAMVPALAGLAGLLLLLPWRVPATFAEAGFYGAVLAGVVLTAGGSVWLHELLRGSAFLWAVSVAAFANAFVFGLAGLARGERLSGLGGAFLLASAIEVPSIFLLLWLVRELAPERCAARFFLVPLVTVLEGAVMLRPPVDARMVVGLLLLLFGGAALVVGKRESAIVLSLR